MSLVALVGLCTGLGVHLYVSAFGPMLAELSAVLFFSFLAFRAFQYSGRFRRWGSRSRDQCEAAETTYCSGASFSRLLEKYQEDQLGNTACRDRGSQC